MRFVIHTQCFIHVDLNSMQSSVSEGIIISLETVLLAILALLI